MAELSISDIVKSIDELGTRQSYGYFTGKTRMRVTTIKPPDGPIGLVRWPSDEPESEAKPASISTNQLATVASVFSAKPDYPIHFDRLFSGSGNNRAALETLLAHTPHFFICYPERTNPYTGRIEKKLKHLMWCPDESHPVGELEEKQYDRVISEVELGINIGEVGIPAELPGFDPKDMDTKRRHTQVQAALVDIGNAMKLKTWIAKNDRSVTVGGKKLAEREAVISSLDEVSILFRPEAKMAAVHIDCIWFTADFKYMPAVIEVEQSTGVTPGLVRMLKFRETIPSTLTSYTIAAPNLMRYKVVCEANAPTFHPLSARFLPYSTISELLGLIQRYSLSGVVDRTFVEPFLEKVVQGGP